MTARHGAAAVFLALLLASAPSARADGSAQAGPPRVYPHFGTTTVDTSATAPAPARAAAVTPNMGLRTLARLDVRDSSAAATDGSADVPTYPVIVPDDNRRVQACIAAYSGRYHKTVQRWLDRSGPYFPMVATTFQRNRLPIELACVVFIESGFRSGARSWAAAVGPWQFIASTARLFGLSITREVDERHDLERSTEAAARMFSHLYEEFGSWQLALAAYNCGEGRVQRAVASQGTSDYWALRLPRETQGYVPQFMAIVTIMRDPARYGFTLPGSEPLVYRELRVPKRTNLANLARKLSVPPASVASLNPAYRRGWAPAGARVRVPIGVSADEVKGIESPGAVVVAVAETAPATGTPTAVEASVGPTLPGPTASAAPAPAPKKPRTVRVKRGESLWKIARRAGVTPDEIRAWNGLSKRSRLVPGQILRVERAEGATTGATSGPPTAVGRGSAPANGAAEGLAMLRPTEPAVFEADAGAAPARRGARAQGN